MTPKEKAIELVNKFNKYTVVCVTHYSNGKMGENKQDAKQCALIAVSEIIKTNPYEWDGEDLNSTIDYWQEVKQEIEKL